MTPRMADDRIGHFMVRRWDFSSDSASSFPEVYYVKRWRLEKKDPDAEMSEPKVPIVYWLDRDIPVKYRETIKAGVLEWNKAFEKIGFKDAIRVEMQPDDATFSTADTRHASIRWVVRDEPGALAIGPSRADPRTGEILDADVEIEDGWTRLPRRQASEQFAPRAHASGDEGFCDYGDVAMDELAFALDLLVARGEIDPDSPEAEKYVLATLKDVVTHEVGHTLGLQHNFRASTIYTQKQLSDPAFTAVHGIGGSVMDYNAVNLALQDEPQADYVMHSLGPYDYWAIEYAYKPIPPAQEKEELAKIAARSGEPDLAFGNDIDAGFGGSAEGMDPQVNRRDLGSDPLDYAMRRLTLSRELWARLQDRQLKPGESYEMLRRNFLSGLTQLGNAGVVSAKYVGGVVYVRDHAGSGRDPFTPVPAAKQRAALKLIADGLLSVDSFRLRPEFVRRLTVDQFDRYRDDAGSSAITPDIALTLAHAGRAARGAGPADERRRGDAHRGRRVQANARQPELPPFRALRHASGRNLERTEDRARHRRFSPQPPARIPAPFGRYATAAVAERSGRCSRTSAREREATARPDQGRRVQKRRIRRKRTRTWPSARTRLKKP